MAAGGLSQAFRLSAPIRSIRASLSRNQVFPADDDLPRDGLHRTVTATCRVPANEYRRAKNAAVTVPACGKNDTTAMLHSEAGV
jgi:hypothetical protein